MSCCAPTMAAQSPSCGLGSFKMVSMWHPKSIMIFRVPRVDVNNQRNADGTLKGLQCQIKSAQQGCLLVNVAQLTSLNMTQIVRSDNTRTFMMGPRPIQMCIRLHGRGRRRPDQKNTRTRTHTHTMDTTQTGKALLLRRTLEIMRMIHS